MESKNKKVCNNEQKAPTTIFLIEDKFFDVKQLNAYLVKVVLRNQERLSDLRKICKNNSELYNQIYEYHQLISEIMSIDDYFLCKYHFKPNYERMGNSLNLDDFI